MIALFPFVCAPVLRAQESVATLDPAATKIDFTLGATLHTVHGTFKLKSGEIRFDPSTGKASGSVTVDATTAETGNSGRDSKMHKEILESAKFPEIVFTPTQVKGSIAPQGTSNVELSGAIRLHGQDHDIRLIISVEPAVNGELHASTKFAVPYIKWGLKNPSNFFLRVSDTVDVEVHATARLAPAH
ncbi:MAG TPA: YceI family protein [Candidatus Acidoferrales bacterium]|nr:YceI family protein [Candidatus Acidoferrales bacterium]